MQISLGKFGARTRMVLFKFRKRGLVQCLVAKIRLDGPGQGPVLPLLRPLKPILQPHQRGPQRSHLFEAASCRLADGLHHAG